MQARNDDDDDDDDDDACDYGVCVHVQCTECWLCRVVRRSWNRGSTDTLLFSLELQLLL